jgi:hypothetical protein
VDALRFQRRGMRRHLCSQRRSLHRHCCGLGEDAAYHRHRHEQEWLYGGNFGGDQRDCCRCRNAAEFATATTVTTNTATTATTVTPATAAVATATATATCAPV